MRRRYRGILIAVVVLAVAAEAAYWRFVSDQLRTGYQQWLGAQVARGWDVGSGAVSIGGWPYSGMITVRNLTFRHARPAIPAPSPVASAGITLSVSLLDPTAIEIALTGPTHVRADGLSDVILTAEEASVRVPLRDSGTLSVALHAKSLRLEPATGAWHGTVGLMNGQARITAGSDPGPSASGQAGAGQAGTDQGQADQVKPAASFVLNAEAIALPAIIKWPLGPNISSLSVDGTLNGTLPGTGDVTQWAEAWRDGGGSLEIGHLTLGWGPLGLTSSATLALDDQLQPMGSGSGRIVGYAETLDRLAAAGMLTKSAATAAKAVLSLMAGTSDTDRPSSVDVPLTLQYRTLSMRQVPLVRLPELDWPAR